MCGSVNLFNIGGVATALPNATKTNFGSRKNYGKQSRHKEQPNITAFYLVSFLNLRHNNRVHHRNNNEDNNPTDEKTNVRSPAVVFIIVMHRMVSTGIMVRIISTAVMMVRMVPTLVIVVQMVQTSIMMTQRISAQMGVPSEVMLDRIVQTSVMLDRIVQTSVMRMVQMVSTAVMKVS